MFRKILQLFLLGLCFSIMGCEEKSDTQIYTANLIQLIANPSQFDEKEVSVTGFLRKEGGHYFLTISMEVEHPSVIEGVVIEVMRDRQTLSQMDACVGYQIHVIGTFGETRGLGLWGINAVKEIVREGKVHAASHKCLV